jgi:hypothetical protein
MISSVNPYPTTFTLRENGNASLDYLNLALVVQTSKNLTHASMDFISTFNPHKLYLNVQNINNKQANSFISTYA